MTHRQIMEALTGLLAAFFTAIISSTIVANALPTIMSELKGTQTDFAWVITAALLANAATTPDLGQARRPLQQEVPGPAEHRDLRGRLRDGGLVPDIPLLLTARVIQGIAMGGLTALAQAIIGSMIPPRDRGKYSGYMGAVMAVGTAGGPLLGGFIVDSPLGWRWTFFVCVPLAVIALILLQITLKTAARPAPGEDRLARLRPADLRRQPAADLGLLRRQPGLLRLVVLADRSPWWAAASCSCWPCWCSVESRVAQPIIPLKIISERTTALPSSPPWRSASACSAPPPSWASTSRWHAVPRPTEAGAADAAHDRRQPDRLGPPGS